MSNIQNFRSALPDGSEARTAEAPPRRSTLAGSIGSGLARRQLQQRSTAAETDLTAALGDGDVVAIITRTPTAGRHVLRHSTAHVLAQAVTQLYPGAKFSIGPAIENGFYYDFDLPDGQTFHEDDLGGSRSR